MSRAVGNAGVNRWPRGQGLSRNPPTQVEFARRWRDVSKAVFSSTTRAVGWNARLLTGDAVTEITRLKTEDGGPLDDWVKLGLVETWTFPDGVLVTRYETRR